MTNSASPTLDLDPKINASSSDSPLKRRALWDRLELPTWGLIAVIYGGWGATVYFHNELPIWLLVVLGAWFICWHMHLQHEILHGHPTRSVVANTLLGMWSLNLAYPYLSYRATHLVHHRDSHLTCPFEDPESYYMSLEAWQKAGPFARQFRRFFMTSPGRILLSPFVGSWGFWTYMLGKAVKGDRFEIASILLHLVSVAGVLGFVIYVAEMPVWLYVLTFSIPGLGLASVRSFAEHRARTEVTERIAIVENAHLFSWLFLHNNLHSVHHDRPGVAWYRTPAIFKANREQYLSDNGGYHFENYIEVLGRFMMRPLDEPLHPFLSVRPEPEVTPLKGMAKAIGETAGKAADAVARAAFPGNDAPQGGD